MDPGNERPGELRRRLATRLASATRYEILGEIARGGMGRIFRVRDRELGRELAMKVLEPGESGERHLARFLEEARLTSQLDHPGIVPLHDVGVLPDGNIFYTMPLVEGRTLDEVLKLARAGQEGWSRARVLHVLLRACEALTYAHERGVVHRDVKPANLMVGRHGEVLVMDWGLARHERHGRGGALGGTPATIPPDLLAGKGEVDALADVYAFGAILYALCAGGLPYEDAGQSVDLGRILRGPPTPLVDLDPTLPPDLIAITEKAMARDPRARYGSMDELREELQRFLEGRIVAAHPVGRVERVRKWVRRNPQLAAGLAVTFTLLLALVLVQREKMHRVGQLHQETLKRAYVANLSAADASLRTGETGEAKRRLDACEPELRGWEWRHLRFQVDSSESVIPVSSHHVDALVASPDGAHIATGTRDGVILWDAATGERLAERALAGGVECLAFSPSGDELVAGLANGALVRLGPHDLAERGAAQAHAFGVSRLAFSPSGEALASLSLNSNEVRLERAGGAVLIAEVAIPSSLVFAGEETLAIGLSATDVHLFDARDLSNLEHIATGRVESLACHPDGRRLAAGCLDGRVLLLDKEDCVVSWAARPHFSRVGALAWDPSGRTLATGAEDKSIALLSADNGETLSQRYGHEDRVEALAFLQNGARLASGSSDGTLRLWRTAGGAQTILAPRKRLISDWIESVAFLPTSARLATLDWEPALHVWNAGSGTLLDSLPLSEKPSRLAAAPEGALVACAVGNEVVEFDLEALAQVGSFDLSPALAYALAYGPRGCVIARTSKGALVELAPGAPPRAVAGGLDEFASALAVDRRRNLAAVGERDGRVLAIDLASGRTVHDWPVASSAVSALAFDDAGERLLAGTADGAVVLLDAADGGVLATLRGHDARVTAVAFAPDGDRLFTASQDKTLRVWDGSDLLLTLRGHEDGLLDLSLQTSGERIASCSKDGTVRLWSSPADLQ